MSPPAGQDEDDGGFLNTSNRSKPCSRPSSQQIDEVQVPLLTQGHPTSMPQVASDVPTGISAQSPPVASRGGMTRTTSSQGATSNLAPNKGAYNGSPNQNGNGDKSLHSLSYTEFTKGLLSVTKNPPLPVSAGENLNLRLSGSGFIPSSYYLNHHDAKDQRHKPHKSRGGRGYESDTGYKSDSQVYRRKKHYNPDGYVSDWEAVQRHHISQKYPQRDGYSSDYDGYKRKGSGNYNVTHQPHSSYRPHSSYHPSSQPNVSYSNSASQRSVNSQRSGSHHSIASQNHRQAGYGHSRSSGGGSQAGGAPRQPPGGYTNVPSTKRTMLRNDEMYEMYPGARHAQNKPNVTNQQHSQSRHSLNASNTSITQRQNPADHRQSNPSLVNVQHTPPSNRHMASQQNTPNRNYNTPGNQSEDWNTPQSQHKTNLTKENGGGSSTEDEIWRAQLYQASVKLQKTPSEKRKSVQVNILNSFYSSMGKNLKLVGQEL